jgi:GH25 family lysozyme M1 (1,4-beta-N-acetylmuramidase)
MGESASHREELLGLMGLYGIDVGYEHEGLDWDAYRQAGFLYRLFKATEGETWPDQDEPDRVKEFRVKRDSAPVVYNGIYHFARPDNHPEPRGEAKHFVHFVGELRPGEGVMLDWEPPELGIVVDPARCQEWVIGWLDAVEAAWPAIAGKVLFYANVSEVNRINTDIISERMPLHVAAYGPDDGQEHPAALGLESYPGRVDRWAAPTLWQFSSKGRVAVLDEDVDVNRFDGSEADLQALAVTGGAEE